MAKKEAPSDLDCLLALEQRYEAKITGLVQGIKEAQSAKTLTAETLNVILPHANQLFLSKIMLRLLALAESPEVVPAQTLLVLWNTADQLMKTFIPSQKELSHVQQTTNRIQKMRQKIARKEKEMVGRINRHAQKVARPAAG